MELASYPPGHQMNPEQSIAWPLKPTPIPPRNAHDPNPPNTVRPYVLPPEEAARLDAKYGPLPKPDVPKPEDAPKPAKTPEELKEHRDLLDDQAAGMHARGMTYRQIGAALGIAHSLVHRRVMRSLHRHRAEYHKHRADRRDLWLRMLDQALPEIHKQARAGDKAAFKLLVQYVNTSERVSRIPDPTAIEELLRKNDPSRALPKWEEDVGVQASACSQEGSLNAVLQQPPVAAEAQAAASALADVLSETLPTDSQRPGEQECERGGEQPGEQGREQTGEHKRERPRTRRRKPLKGKSLPRGSHWPAKRVHGASPKRRPAPTRSVSEDAKGGMPTFKSTS